MSFFNRILRRVSNRTLLFLASFVALLALATLVALVRLMPADVAVRDDVSRSSVAWKSCVRRVFPGFPSLDTYSDTEKPILILPWDPLDDFLFVGERDIGE